MNNTIDLAGVIDHTILKADCSKEDFLKVCDEALEYHFSAVCIPPYFVKGAVEKLADSPIKVATVIGFPMGYSTTAAKVEEIKRALNDGVDEIDVVINILAVKNKDWAYVKNDIDSMMRAAHLKGKVVKIILELSLLDTEEIEKLCEMCNDIEVDYVKTSTGYHGKGASPKFVNLLKQLLKNTIKIEASGGIQTKEAALKLIQAGAHRIGTSSSVQIIK